MKKLYSIVGMWIVSAFCLLSAQSRVYSSVENVHSHNDYCRMYLFILRTPHGVLLSKLMCFW